MLAVVRRRLGVALAVGERLDRSAEGGPRLEHRHLVSRVDELERSSEPGKAAPDNCDFHRASAPPTTRSFLTGDREGGPSKTSNPFFSIRSSVER